MTYAIARIAQDQAEARHKAATAALMAASGDERGPMGLTPDHVKATPEWKAAFRAERQAFSELRAIGQHIARNYKAEARAERDAKRKNPK